MPTKERPARLNRSSGRKSRGRSAYPAANAIVHPEIARSIYDEPERLAALIDSIEDEVWFADEKKRLTLVNPAVVREFGARFGAATPLEEIIAGLEVYRSDGVLRPVEEAPPLRAFNGEIVRNEEEIVRTPATGELRHRQVTAAPVRNRAGKIMGTVSVARDITDLKRTEKELYESEQRYRALAETSPEAIVVHRQNEFLYANPAALTMYGARSFDQLRKRNVFDFLAPDGSEPIARILKNIEEGKPLPHREGRLIRLDGKEVHIESYAAYVIYGKSRAVQVILRDVTERRRGEEALRQANLTLERRIEERTAELAQRAAQLRALAGELTLTEQSERRRLAALLHDHLQQLLVAAKFRTAALGKTLDDSGHQATGEIEELIDECIGASRSLTAELSPPILHEAGLNAGLQWLAKRVHAMQGLTVELDTEEIDPLPEDLRVLLFESVRELLFNVAKHARTQSAMVVVRRLKDSLRVTVADRGIGFDAESLPPAGESGGGFGLFGIRERMELFGGELRINSAPGQGSWIVLSAPLAGSPATPSALLPVPPAAARPTRIARPADGRKIRILLADDHRMLRQGIANLIRNQPDLEIVGEAGDGGEAVGLAAKLQPDVLLMDVSMPKMSGIEATHCIHRDFPRIRIIGMSMYEEADRAHAMRHAGAIDYLTKSGPVEELIEAIRRSLRRRRSTTREAASRARRRSAQTAHDERDDE